MHLGDSVTGKRFTDRITPNLGSKTHLVESVIEKVDESKEALWSPVLD